MLIKENCWKWPVQNDFHFIKIYEDYQVAKKVKTIHRQLAHIDFPYVLPLLQSEPYTVRQRWEDGEALQFDELEQRQQAMRVLEALHATKEQIQWQQVVSLPRFHLQRKWHARLQKFRFYRPLLQPKIGAALYRDIERWAERAYNQIDFQLTDDETLLHGDVAHHNFLKLNDQRVVLIDFDLACLGSASDELVLLGHRFLSHYHYDVAHLLQHFPMLAQKKTYFAYPNELLREALYLLQIGEETSRHYEQFFQPFAARAILYADTLLAK